MEELKELRNEILNLRNIGELTKQTESILLSKLNSLEQQLTLACVSQQRELLKAYTKWLNDKIRDENELDELIGDYFDSL